MAQEYHGCQYVRHIVVSSSLYSPKRAGEGYSVLRRYRGEGEQSHRNRRSHAPEQVMRTKVASNLSRREPRCPRRSATSPRTSRGGDQERSGSAEPIFSRTLALLAGGFSSVCGSSSSGLGAHAPYLPAWLCSAACTRGLLLRGRAFSRRRLRAGSLSCDE